MSADDASTGFTAAQLAQIGLLFRHLCDPDRGTVAPVRAWLCCRESSLQRTLRRVLARLKDVDPHTGQVRPLFTDTQLRDIIPTCAAELIPSHPIPSVQGP